MKKILALFTVSLFFVFECFAQDLCGTPAITNVENARKLRSPQKRTANTNYTLRVYFHVIRRSSGTGGVSTSNVASAYSRLNDDFDEHGIHFFWDGIIDYIDNDSYYYNIPDTTIFHINNQVNGIDIYLYPAFPIYSYTFIGKAHGVGVSSEYLVVGNVSGTPACTTSTISHEMGHVLNLWHTHHGTVTEGIPSNPGFDSNQCKELVNGSNSSTCGDYVEDTPADPNLSGKVNSNCVYTGTGTDANNQAYNPDVSLIMSYAPKSCRTRFSSKQGERMREAIENLQHLTQVQWQGYISGPTVPCGTSTYSLGNIYNGCTVQWSLQNHGTPSYLIQNSPSINMCQINATGLSLTDNLIANVYSGSNLVATVSKAIDTSDGFTATYSQPSYTLLGHTYPAINNCVIHNGGKVIVGAGGVFTVTSSDFVGATITQTSGTGVAWSQSGSTLTMQAAISTNGQTASMATFLGEKGCQRFTFKVLPFTESFHKILDLSITSENGNCIISLIPNQDIDSVNDITDWEYDWTLTISNVITGKKNIEKQVSGNSTSVDTSKWEKGVYVVKAKIGNYELSKKITL